MADKMTSFWKKKKGYLVFPKIGFLLLLHSCLLQCLPEGLRSWQIFYKQPIK